MISGLGASGGRFLDLAGPSETYQLLIQNRSKSMISGLGAPGGRFQDLTGLSETYYFLTQNR